MKNKIYKTMRVVDCQHMPDNIKKAFFNSQNSEPSNDCYIMWYHDNYDDNDSKLVQKYLEDNGIKDDVLIKYWW
jgi:hypothetical protein